MRKANAAISILGLGLALLLAWAPMAGADTYTYTYNAADQLAGVQGPNGAASYTYDGDGQRTTRSTAAGQTIYVRDPQGEVIAEYSGTTGALLAEYVYVDGQRLCKITHDANNVEHRVYYHQDVVGTPVAETNESGQVLVRAQYYPFGEEVIPGAASDPHKFTGKELDDESGLYYFGARYYDAHLGRFVSVDPLPGENEDPQSWNRYAYGLNNPMKFIDPDGESSLRFDGGASTITLMDRHGNVIATWPAYNNVQHTNPNGRWEDGTYHMLDSTAPHMHGEPADTPAGEYGPHGSVRARDFTETNGNHRTTMAVHSGRTDVPDSAGRTGPHHATNGCIRTTDDAMGTIESVMATDPLETITVTNNKPPVPPPPPVPSPGQPGSN